MEELPAVAPRASPVEQQGGRLRYEEIPTGRMYGDLARLWPWISPPEDYEEEAQFWKAALRAKLGGGRHRVLELGVGGGHHLSHLCSELDAIAVDLSEEMMAHSRRLNPQVEHIMGDMRTVRLGRTFDAVLIHDAIDYMLTTADLRATFETAKAHLQPGGVLIVAPDYTCETFEDGAIYSQSTVDGKMRLSHVEIDFDPDPSDTTIESLMLSLIREGDTITVELDRHVVGLFPRRTWMGELAACGFDVERWPTRDDDDPRQRELYVCILGGTSSGGGGERLRGPNRLSRLGPR